MKTNKNVKQWLAIIMVGLFTFLSVIQVVPIGMDGQGLRMQDVEASGKFDDSELTSVLPSAYYITKNTVTSDGSKFGDKSKQFEENVKEVSGQHFGNIGLFVGFPGDSESQLAALNTPNAISINDSNNYFRKVDVEKYYAFGAAVQDLSKKGIKSKKVEESSQRIVDGVSNSAKSLTKAGARLVRDYNPAPILLSLYRTENGPKGINLNTGPYADNKLVQIVVENETLSGMLNLIRTPPTGSDSAKATLFTWIVFVTVVMLIVAGVLMKVLNGRAAGESYRKAVVKIVVSTLAVPVMANLLNYGVNTFVDVTDPDITPKEEYAEKAIGEHLNFADWYATGFAVPDGAVLEIKDGKFRLSQGQIKEINKNSYRMVVGETPNAESVYNRLLSAGDQNFAEPSFVEKNGWDGMAVKQVGNTIVENEDGEDVDLDSDGGGGIAGFLSKITGGSEGSYLYGFRNEMSGSGGEYTVVAGSPDAGAGESNRYGISPLASYNMMRSSFSGGNIASSLSKPQMASVVYSAYVRSDGKEMNGITKLIATYAMVMAAMKGLASIFASGIGGILSGAAGGGLGSSAGMGQGIGGIVALVGGVLGMGLIMNISFIFIDELYAIFFDIFQGTAPGDPTMLDPLKDMIDDVNLPSLLAWLKPFLKGALESLSTLFITLASAIALPKFGKIPINIYAQKMSELPSNFAERAQQMENRFTGDYRAGAGGRGAMISSFNSQMTQVGGETSTQMKGVGEAAAAGAGMAVAGVGMGLSALGDYLMGDEDDGKPDDATPPDDGGGVGPGGPPDDGGGGEDAIQVGEELHEGTELSNEDNIDGDNLDGDEGDNLTAVDGDESGEGKDSSSVKEGGSKETIQDSKSSRDTSGGQKDSISGITGDHNVDETSDTAIDGSGEFVTSDNIAADQSSFNAQNMSVEDGNYQSSEQNISSASQEIGGNQSISRESGGVSQEIGGDQRTSDTISSVAGGSSVNTSVDAGSNVHSSLSADQRSSVQQNSDTVQDSNRYVSSQRSSTNIGHTTQGQSIGGAQKLNTQAGQSPQVGAGVSSVNTNQQSSNQGKSGNLKTGTPTMAHRTNNPVSGQMNTTHTNTPNKSVNRQGQAAGGGPNNPHNSHNSPKGTVAAAGGGPNNPHNSPKGTVAAAGGGPNNPPKKAQTPKKNTSFKLKAGKATRALGRGLQGLGGEVSVNRAVSAAKHAGASAFVGGHTQQKTQAELNKAQGKVNVPRSNSSNPQPNQPTNDVEISQRESDILRQEEILEQRENKDSRRK